MNDPIRFIPSLRRLVFKETLRFAVVYSLVMGIYEGLTGHFRLESWLFLSLFVPALYCFFRFLLPLISAPHFFTIEVSDQQIIGPYIWSPITVPLKEVDIAKSCRRSWIQALNGYHSLRFLDGRGIWFDDYAYGKGQFDRLLEIISQLQNASATQLQDAQ